MTDGPTCPPVDDPDLPVVPDHEAHRHGRPPKARVGARARDLATRRFSLVGPCAVPGVSLTNYSLNATQKGWGNPCTQARTTITLSNGVRITVATRIARLATLVLNECIRRGYVIRQQDTGAYNCRYISGTTVWSNHAWAVAIDIDWLLNPYTSGTTHNIPDWMADLLNRYGFAWGGDYSGSRRDYMHFEFMGSPAQADAATALAERELPGGKNYVPAGGGAGGGGGGTTGYPPFLWGIWTDAAPGTRLIGLGSRGPNDVQVVQRWHGLTDDGWFGTDTYDKVRETQRRNGLVDDGLVGPATWRVLGF